MNILSSFNLQAYNTLGLECIAQCVVQLDHAQDLAPALQILKKYSKYYVLGQGSNTILPAHYNGLIMHWQTQPLRDEHIRILQQDDKHIYIRVPAHAVWHDWVALSLHYGYGLENLALIPGLVGAAPIQNIGAYGVEVQNYIHAVHAVCTQTGDNIFFNAVDCQFAYRDSVFKRSSQYIITHVDFALKKHFQAQLSYKELADQWHPSEHASQDISAQMVFDAVVRIRQNKLPDWRRLPNAGSFFKNPVITQRQYQTLKKAWPDMPSFVLDNGTHKLSAAWLIDQCAWRGKVVDGVGMYAKHALVLINHHAKYAQQVLHLATLVQNDVTNRFGVDLEIEPISPNYTHHK